MNIITFEPIGVIHTPFPEPVGVPLQSYGAAGIEGQIELLPEYEEGLADIDGFSHLILIYHLHRATGFDLTVTPFLDTEPHGIFATRSPRRPNGIGMSVVRLLRVEGPTVYIEGVDMVDDTPLLDIKPYVPQFDSRGTDKIGWLTGKVEKAATARADRRFVKP
jgi:tRNA-Thr(GGU) m(6)t(6)A37 methyltransferase TsaA